MAADRTLTVDIAIPAAAGYAHTTFNDARVYLLGLATTAQVTVEFVKRGTSKLLDLNGKVPPPARSATQSTPHLAGRNQGVSVPP